MNIDPWSIYYYDRIGASKDDPQDEVDRSAKLALGEVKSEQVGKEKVFVRVHQARKVLTDEENRQCYDTFCERFGPESGTETFELWDDRGRPGQPEQWEPTPKRDSQSRQPGRQQRDGKRQGDQQEGRQQGKRQHERDGDNQDQRKSPHVEIPINRDQLENPHIFQRRNVPSHVNVNYWRGDTTERLYINNFHPKGDIFIELESGRIYTVGNQPIEDIKWSHNNDVTKIWLTYGDRKIGIDLIGFENRTDNESHRQRHQQHSGQGNNREKSDQQQQPDSEEDSDSKSIPQKIARIPLMIIKAVWVLLAIPLGLIGWLLIILAVLGFLGVGLALIINILSVAIGFEFEYTFAEIVYEGVRMVVLLFIGSLLRIPMENLDDD